MVEIENIKQYTCTKCQIIKTEDEYYHHWIWKNTRTKTEKILYRNPRCKECGRKDYHERVKKDPEKRRVQAKIANQKPKRVLAHRANGKRQRLNGYLKQYQQNNPEKLKQYDLQRQHKNHNITKSEWAACKEYFNNQCAYCGLSINQHFITRGGVTKLGDFHKEHVDHNGNNDLSNCVPSCRNCNSQKWKFEFEDWYIESNPIFSHARLSKIHSWLNKDYNIKT